MWTREPVQGWSQSESCPDHGERRCTAGVWSAVWFGVWFAVWSRVCFPIYWRPDVSGVWFRPPQRQRATPAQPVHPAAAVARLAPLRPPVHADVATPGALRPRPRRRPAASRRRSDRRPPLELAGAAPHDLAVQVLSSTDSLSSKGMTTPPTWPSGSSHPAPPPGPWWWTRPAPTPTAGPRPDVTIRTAAPGPLALPG